MLGRCALPERARASFQLPATRRLPHHPSVSTRVSPAAAMEAKSSPRPCDRSLGSDGTSPYTASVSEDSSCELSPNVAGGATASDFAESPLGDAEKHSSPIARLMERTGYGIVQQNGQRRYGPPPDWEGEPPYRGCEVFVGKIPRDCFEDELVPVFEKAGKIYELRLMMEFNGQNRGYAFVVFGAVEDAKECVRLLNNYEIRKGRTLGICMSVDNCRLFVGGIPKKVCEGFCLRTKSGRVTRGVRLCINCVTRDCCGMARLRAFS